MEDGDGDWRCRSSSKPFEAGSRGTLGRRFRAEKGGAQGGRYKGEKVNTGGAKRGEARAVVTKGREREGEERGKEGGRGRVLGGMEG